MPTLNIKNPEVYELARRIADHTGQSMTEVVADALRDRLDIVFADERRQRIEVLLDDIHKRARNIPADAVESLYDPETGLPV